MLIHAKIPPPDGFTRPAWIKSEKHWDSDFDLTMVKRVTQPRPAAMEADHGRVEATAAGDAEREAGGVS
jgi:hypothetical protein